ncbi:hypothetical protein AT6N2_C2433 [Agrobacterium tumefaciens]|nr:hypothetical protein AT6N2_C2433 [Agrobacterium tumefaciens]
MRGHGAIDGPYLRKIRPDDIGDDAPSIIDAQHVDGFRSARLEAELGRVEVIIFAIGLQWYRGRNILEGGERAKIDVKLLFFLDLTVAVDHNGDFIAEILAEIRFRDRAADLARPQAPAHCLRRVHDDLFGHHGNEGFEDCKHDEEIGNGEDREFDGCCPVARDAEFFQQWLQSGQSHRGLSLRICGKRNR